MYDIVVTCLLLLVVLLENVSHCGNLLLVVLLENVSHCGNLSPATGSIAGECITLW